MPGALRSGIDSADALRVSGMSAITKLYPGQRPVIGDVMR